jgi:LPXTG-motif cell wall-anchored protein
MFRRLAAFVAIAAAALFVSAGSASANYTPTTAPGTTSSSTVHVGGSVVFSYTGGQYAPGTQLTYSVTYGTHTTVVGHGVATAQGNFSTPITLRRPGLATLTATGLTSTGGTLTVTATVRVLAPAAAAAGTPALPRTGSDLGTQLWIAGGLLAAGGSLVLLSVSRRRHARA